VPGFPDKNRALPTFMSEKKKKNETKAGNGQKKWANARFLRGKPGRKTGKKGLKTAEKGRFRAFLS